MKFAPVIDFHTKISKNKKTPFFDMYDVVSET